MTPPRHRSSAFTLIELLTVIGIIGILAAILIPVVGSVRERANLAKSVSKLRQFHEAAQLWSSDNRGMLVPAQGWYISLFEYYGPAGLTDGQKYTDRGVWEFLPNPSYDYAWHPDNSKSNNNSPNRFGYGMNALPLMPTEPGFFYGNGLDVPRQPMAKITHPANRPMFGEANNATITYAPDGSRFYEGGPYNLPNQTDRNPNAVFHDGQAAYVMFDGHVEQFSAEEALARLSRPGEVGAN